MPSTSLYRTIWRWHFYAGLFVVPMVFILSLTGAIYLFNPQVVRWEERAWQNLPAEHAATPDTQVGAALAAFPGAKFHSLRLPRQASDATLIHLGLAGNGRAMRDVFVSPQGKVVGSLNPENRIMKVVHDIHGQLLMGHRGSWIVELAASWAIVMIVTGLYLWWPRGRGAAGVVYPRLSLGSKTAWRDMHAVTGFWVSGLALVLLLTGLPWADVWGGAFKALRSEMGWVKGKQDWTIGGRAPASDEHAEHDHAAMMSAQNSMPEMDHKGMENMGGMNGMHAMSPVTLTQMVAEAKSLHLAFPVIVTPPGAPGRFGRKGATDWTIRSDSQNRPLRVTVTYDAMTGRETKRETFADGHPIDQVVGYGVAWHEGQLFGWINQLIGVLTAIMLLTLSVTGFVMWRRRKPDNMLGAPPASLAKLQNPIIKVLVAFLILVLPMFAISVATIWLIDRIVISRTPQFARWLGMSYAATGLQ